MFGSKVSGYEFYQALARLTNNVGEPVPDRYSAFMRIVREWRHIRLLKRSGRGHEPSGVSGTIEGECAVLCPACPHPGKNLPANWEKAGDTSRWVYSLFLAIDANFRLKRLSASNDTRDPSLNRGSAYFVEEVQYKDFLSKHRTKKPQEDSTCNNYDAVKSASIRGGKGTTASGVGTIECSRHDMKRPVSVGDLQLGEQYVNMDYLYFSSVKNHAPTSLVVSYDIACQWSCKLILRSQSYPMNLITPRVNDLHATYLVPKFHLYAHQTDCQINYSFNLTPGVGRTDGEAPERGWAAMNPVASSTKEMGPGSRRDTLDDHFRDYNWRKIVALHISLLNKVQEAVEMRSEHVSNFLTLSKSLPDAVVQQFTTIIHQWEAGTSQDNPYQAMAEVTSAAKIRLQLAEEDATTLSQGDSLLQHDSISGSVLIAQALDLQDQMARLKLDANALGTHSTDIQRTRIQERRNRMKRLITAWQTVQEAYVPGVGAYRCRTETMRDGDLTETHPEDIRLLLPSDLSPHFRVDSTLSEYEWRLRNGVAHDCLAELRRLLLILSSMYKSKDRLVHGQVQNTRSVTLIKNVQARIDFTARKYRMNRQSLVTLATLLSKHGWETTLQVLNDEDIHSLRQGDDASESEGRRTLSWIWMTGRTSDAEMSETMSEGRWSLFQGGNTKNDSAIRIEWCKSRARAHRWQEECILLQEEMRRVTAFHEWQAGIWEARAITAATEGARAYAWRQMDSRVKLRKTCVDAWKSLPAYLSMGEGVVAMGGQLTEAPLSTSLPP
ncbi:hypothetical protein PTI98_009225 [Pleurotus ostreatus]|nr:hypothetical protein PTI98_009225 [Pleurotus ostreatus]